jgi:hypothetical protein
VGATGVAGGCEATGAVGNPETCLGAATGGGGGVNIDSGGGADGVNTVVGATAGATSGATGGAVMVNPIGCWVEVVGVAAFTIFNRSAELLVGVIVAAGGVTAAGRGVTAVGAGVVAGAGATGAAGVVLVLKGVPFANNKESALVIFPSLFTSYLKSTSDLLTAICNAIFAASLAALYPARLPWKRLYELRSGKPAAIAVCSGVCVVGALPAKKLEYIGALEG